MKILHGSPAIEQFSELVHKYSDAKLAKPTRSAVPLLDYWRDAQTRLPPFLKTLGLPEEAESSTLCFEYPVSSFDPEAKPSITDLMILHPSAAIAVEAKWTEKRYEPLEVRLKQARSNREEQVIQHWLNMIQPFAGKPLTFETLPKDMIVYQSLHRTASACHVARQRGGKAFVVYQVFVNEWSHPDYDEMLLPLFEAIQPNADLELWTMTTPLKLTDNFSAISSRDGGDRKNLSKEVRAALNRGGLFEFGEPKLMRIQLK